MGKKRNVSTVSECYIGWDVGAWNCDGGESQDALVALQPSLADGPEVVGIPWRGNLRSDLDELAGEDLAVALLRKCQLEPSERFHATFAIDTPLGWPQPMMDLVVRGKPGPIPEKADETPYLFRKTELELFGGSHRPLSAVRDMIGSQSTKGIHFLKKANLRRRSIGVWQGKSKRRVTTAIETYPAPCLKSSTICKRFAALVSSKEIKAKSAKGKNVKSDVEDSLRCALVAWLYQRELGELVAPVNDVPIQEGWIWLPQDCSGAVAT